MQKIRFFVDPIGNTISVWFKDPKEEVVCDVDEDGNILSLDKDDKVFGFEKINFLPQTFTKQLVATVLKEPSRMSGTLLLSAR